MVAGTTGEGADLVSAPLVGMVSATTVVAGTTGESVALAFGRLIGVGSDSHGVGGHDWRERFSGLGSFGRHELSNALWWRGRQERALLWHMFAWSEWAQQATVVAG